MKNKNTVKSHVKALGYELGLYHATLNKLSSEELEKVLETVAFYPTSNTVVMLDGEKFMVETYQVGKQIDFTIQTLEDYIDNGGEYDDED